MKFIQLAKSLQEGLAPVYLIEGEEVYFREHAVRSIREKCALTQPMLNDIRYEGEQLKGEALVSFRDALYALPFFDEKRLVRAYEFYPTERDWTAIMQRYVEKPCPSTVLLIVNAGKKANTAELKKKAGVVYVDCGRESEETLSRWLFGVMRKSGLSVDADAAQRMVRYCASDAARMKRETEKLALLLGENGRVTAQTVEEYVAKDVEYKIYELTQAASRRSFSAFSEILSDLLKKGGFDESAALGALCSHYRTIYDCSHMTGTDGEIAAVLGIKPYAVQKNRETAARLGKERVKEYYLKLYELSSDMKSGKYTRSGALFTAIAKIFFG